MISKGTGTVRRRHGKNYIQEQADARLREVVESYQRQGLNALGVDSFEVKFYHICKSVRLCTCQQTEIQPGFTSKESVTSILTQTQGLADKEIVIDYARPLFGAPGDALYAEDDTGSDEFAIDDEGSAEEQGTPVLDSLFSSSSDCAICFKTGYVPGYELLGYDRQVLTTFDIADVSGYTIDVTTAPHTLVQVDPKLGYVDFVIEVPKYLKGASYIIRNNTTVLVDEVLYDQEGLPLTLSALRASAGRSLLIRCTTSKFTHIVLEFDVGTERVKANLAQASRTTDWTMFDTLGNIQIILPMTIQEVVPGDVVHVPSRNTTFKITDEQYLRTSKDKNLDWQVTARVLQPVETLRSISKTIALG